MEHKQQDQLCSMDEPRLQAIKNLQKCISLLESGTGITEDAFVNCMFEQNGRIYWVRLDEYIPADKWLPAAFAAMGWEFPSVGDDDFPF